MVRAASRQGGGWRSRFCDCVVEPLWLWRQTAGAFIDCRSNHSRFMNIARKHTIKAKQPLKRSELNHVHCLWSVVISGDYLPWWVAIVHWHMLIDFNRNISGRKTYLKAFATASLRFMAVWKWICCSSTLFGRAATSFSANTRLVIVMMSDTSLALNLCTRSKGIGASRACSPHQRDDETLL